MATGKFIIKTEMHQIGLKSSQVKDLQKKYGLNIIKPKGKKPLVLQFFEEFKDVMIAILIIAAILAYIGGEKVDGTVILGIVILNAFIGFFQKYKAEKAVEALKKMVQPHAKVIRDGTEKIIEAKDLVPGDIVILEEGDQVGADAKIIEEVELEINESTLTGESNPVKKDIHPKDKKHLNLDEQTNTVFMGTTVTKGHGKAIVLRTGMETMLGKIAHLTASTKKDKSPLEKELKRIGIFAGKITIVLSVILFATGYFIQNQKFAETLLFATSVAVAAVPEGLPATITIALALGVKSLAKKNAIMKQLSSVETLGSTTVICTDKTGTLTKNEMTVKDIFIPGQNIKVDGVGYEPTEIESLKNFPLEKICLSALLCNNSKLTKEDNSWKIIGDPTEGALITASAKAGFKDQEISHKWKREKEFPFSSERKMMTVIVKNKYEKHSLAFSKGALTIILEKCTHILKNGRIEELTKADKTEIEIRNNEMSEEAKRVLAFSYKEIEKNKKYEEETVEEKMIFLGLMGMIDPPRPEVANAVELTKKAGIKTYIITGDYGPTAEAIARQIGMVEGKKLKIITGAELDTLSEPRLSKIMKDYPEIIFSRVSPEHKLKIVSVLKKHGEVVAMTGDGVNDAPALKRADIGVAMGIAGTDVSREASNMVLADDSFGTIVNAVEEGRKIYENLKKFILYTFSCNIGELITVFAAIIMKMPPPLTAILILCVNLGTDVLPAIALGADKADPDIMERPPRNPKEKILKKNFIVHFTYLGLLVGGITTAYYFILLHTYNGDSNMYLKASSSAFALLVLIQMWNALNARSARYSVFKIGFFKNKNLLGAILISILIVLALIEIPTLQNLVGTTHLATKEWLIIAALSSTIFIIEEFRKLWIRQ